VGWLVFLTGIGLVAFAPQLSGERERVMVELVLIGYVLVAVSLLM
jgi:hypothetical protein